MIKYSEDACLRKGPEHLIKTSLKLAPFFPIRNIHKIKIIGLSSFWISCESLQKILPLDKPVRVIDSGCGPSYVVIEAIMTFNTISDSKHFKM